ncbi:MAG: glycosyl hydrolase [Acidobacteriota bacterium]
MKRLMINQTSSLYIITLRKTSFRFYSILIVFALTLCFISNLTAQPVSKEIKPKYDLNLYKAMEWRNIGPFRGGRSTAVAGHPDLPYTYYFGGTGGGVWKTEDGGITWVNVSDGFFKTGSVGAIAVAESDPNVVYAGMGERCPRGNVSHGDGVYKSTDGGKTWKNIGLTDSRHIGKIVVHPKNPDIVYVAAMGHIFGPNTERGVFRSKDGGKTWEKILYKDNKTGAVDLVIDPANSRILYAALWEVYRNPWSLNSGGPGSGLHKTTDGGDTWVELTKNPGLPKGIIGKIGIAVSPAKPDRIWAIIEAEDGGVFRSDDGGKTWRLMNRERKLRQRAWYYTHIYADPKDPETIYVLNTGFYKSIDGGKTFPTTISVPHGDNHDLWIDQNNPLRMINANDGGANVSYNGGLSWTDQDQPTAQFYHVIVDNQFPYHVYGAQQDNTTVGIASRTTGLGIDRPDWYPVGGGESGYIAVRSDDPNIVYAGSYGGLITKYNHHTKEIQNISVWPDNPMGSGARDLKYRFQWTAPIFVSPHDSNILYIGGNHLFKSTDEGMSWEIISPDLTRNDKNKQGPSGGPITKDNTSVEYYCVIFALAESPDKKGVIWAGSDDGLIHVTKDGGKNWENVTPKELPEWTLISIIDASPHDPATAYVVATRYKHDDFKPYIYKTYDYGKTWKKITNGIPENDFTRVVREDPNHKGLLYAGTETSVYVSFDDGENWQSLQLNLPIVPIHDLMVHPREKDLVVATHGRSFWILDDLTPLYQLSDEIAKSKMYLFKPRDTYRMRGRDFMFPRANIGKNPPNGTIIYYYFKDKPEQEVKLEILDAKGNLVKTFTSMPKDEQPTIPEEIRIFFGEVGTQKVPADQGMNRFVWDLRYPDAVTVPGALLWAGTTRGAVAVPGTYQVRLKVGENSITQSFEVKQDPRIKTTAQEFQEQFDLLIKIRDKVSEAHEAVNQIRDIRKQLNDLIKRLKESASEKTLVESANVIIKKLSAIEEEIIQVKIESSQDALNYPIQLNAKLASLAGVVASADTKPTKQSYEVFDDLSSKLNAQLSKLKEVIDTDLAAFNQKLREQQIPSIFLKPTMKK